MGSSFITSDLIAVAGAITAVMALIVNTLFSLRRENVERNRRLAELLLTRVDRISAASADIFGLVNSISFTSMEHASDNKGDLRRPESDEVRQLTHLTSKLRIELDLREGLDKKVANSLGKLNFDNHGENALDGVQILMSSIAQLVEGERDKVRLLLGEKK